MVRPQLTVSCVVGCIVLFVYTSFHNQPSHSASPAAFDAIIVAAGGQVPPPLHPCCCIPAAASLLLLPPRSLLHPCCCCRCLVHCCIPAAAVPAAAFTVAALWYIPLLPAPPRRRCVNCGVADAARSTSPRDGTACKRWLALQAAPAQHTCSNKPADLNGVSMYYSVCAAAEMYHDAAVKPLVITTAWGTPHKPCPHDKAGFETHESADNAKAAQHHSLAQAYTLAQSSMLLLVIACCWC